MFDNASGDMQVYYWYLEGKLAIRMNYMDEAIKDFH
jgi:hypothetical protein